MLQKFFTFAQALPPSPGVPGDLGGASGIDPGLAQYWDIESILGKVVNLAVASTGVIAMMMIIIGGFWYLTSAGNSEPAKKGMHFIMYAVIGIVVVSLSYAIAYTFTSAPRSGYDRTEIEYNVSSTSIGSGIEWIGGDWSNSAFW